MRRSSPGFSLRSIIALGAVAVVTATTMLLGTSVAAGSIARTARSATATSTSKTASATLSHHSTATAVHPVGSSPAVSRPQVPRVLPPAPVLWDQYDNDLGNAIVSEARTDDSTLSAQAADDFVVPNGQTWTITEVDVPGYPSIADPSSFNVFFYHDASALPGTLITQQLARPVGGVNPDFVITLSPGVRLHAGTYWLSVQGTVTGQQWFWEGRNVTSNDPTVWQNPGGGYGVCPTWTLTSTCEGFSWPDQMFRLRGTVTAPQPCLSHRILIVHSDSSTPPTTLQTDLASQPGVAGVDLFDAESGTPLLTKLLQYRTVVVFSDHVFFDPVTLGDRIADYLDRYGVVVATPYDWFGSPFDLEGRWVSGNYTPFNDTASNSAGGTLGTFTAGHPLMKHVSALNDTYAENATAASGATVVARWNDASPLIAVKGRAVGITGFLGDFYGAVWSGDFPRVIANAGAWLCARRSDGLIKVSTSHSYSGNNVYNTTGLHQNAHVSAAPGTTKTFDIEIQNDSGFPDLFKVGGPGGSAGFKVSYLKGASGSTSITPKVEAGTYTTSLLAPGKTTIIRLVVNVPKTAGVGTSHSWLVTIRVPGTAIIDAVEGTVKVVA